MAVNYRQKSSNSLIIREDMEITTILRDHLSLIRLAESNQHDTTCAAEALGKQALMPRCGIHTDTTLWRGME